MKTIPNLTYTLNPPPPRKAESTTTAELMADVARYAGVREQGGATIEDQRRRFRILNAVEGLNPGTEIRLEDADAAELKKLATVMRWGWVDAAFNTFTEQIEKA